MHLHPHSTALPQHWRDGAGDTLTLRASAATDATRLGRHFESGLGARSRRQRFHGAVGRLSAQRLAQLANADGWRHHAWLVTRGGPHDEQVIAEARLYLDADGSAAEIALSVADDWQGRGLGRRLMSLLIEKALALKVLRLHAAVMVGNPGMNALLLSNGLALQLDGDDRQQFDAVLDLQPAATSGHGRPAPVLASILSACADALLAARLLVAASFVR